MRVIQRRIVGTLLVSRDNQVVLGYKDSNLGGRYSGCWVVPGGGVEDGETDIEALYREIEEELGVDISGYESVLVDDSLTGENETLHKITKEPVCYKMHFLDYITKIPLDAEEFPIAPKDDLADAKWIPLEELSRYKFSPSTAELLVKQGFLR